jgi:cytochrome P450
MVKMYELDTTLEQAEAATQAAADFREYVLSVVEERRHEPRDDLVTRLVEVEVEGRRLSDAELVSTIVVLLNAGHEATVNTLGNGVLALLRHPDQWAALVAGEVDPAAAVGADPLGSSAPALRALGARGRRRDRRRAGPRGEKVALLFGSANRDPRVFHDPDAFDVSRANAAEHIGFGGGIHVCIGAPLARIELAAALGALVERAPGLSLAEEPGATRPS